MWKNSCAHAHKTKAHSGKWEPLHLVVSGNDHKQGSKVKRLVNYRSHCETPRLGGLPGWNTASSGVLDIPSALRFFFVSRTSVNEYFPMRSERDTRCDMVNIKTLGHSGKPELPHLTDDAEDIKLVEDEE